MEYEKPFFRSVGGSKPLENYLSRVFQACFNQSDVFAECVLSLLWEKCDLPGQAPKSGWTCEYQPATPHGGRLRPDLCLHAHIDGNKDRSVNNAKKHIYLESKLEAPLTREQLSNYKDLGAKTLVAITKRWPKISRSEILDIGANHVRWQDVAHALAKVSPRNAKDKFLCNEFLKYLEYSGMAYREDISANELECVRTLFSKIGSQKVESFVPKKKKGTKSFLISAESCIAVLGDARLIARELSPKLASCNNWGPGYSHGKNEGNETHVGYHFLGMEFYLHGKYNQSKFWCAICFPSDSQEKITWCIRHDGSNAKAGQEIEENISKFLSTKGNGVEKTLDVEMLAKSIVKAVDEWRLF